VQTQTYRDRRIRLPSKDRGRRIFSGDLVGSVVDQEPLWTRPVPIQFGGDDLLVTDEHDLHILVERA
jgi:hypothetical protein